MNIQPLLQKLGFTPKETIVYLACLEHGPDTISNLARLSGLKRPNLYNVIHGLLAKGYVVLFRRNKKTLYDAERPKKLLTSIRARANELEQSLPELEAIRNKIQEEPNIQIYESSESVKNLYDQVYDYLNPREEVCFLTSVEDIIQNLPQVLDAYLAKVRKNHKVRELIPDNHEGRKYAKLLRNKGLNHEVRLLPDQFPVFNDLVIYDHRLIIASFKKRIHAAFFQNKEIFQTMKALYEWAWVQGKTV